jgi:hypothetical protein
MTNVELQGRKSWSCFFCFRCDFVNADADLLPKNANMSNFWNGTDDLELSECGFSARFLRNFVGTWKTSPSLYVTAVNLLTTLI